jgi:hypothetical protein
MEKWVDIQGFEQYQVSTLGRVKSKAKHFMNEKILTGTIDPNGYIRVGLRKDNKPYNRVVHRLVMENFNPTDDMSKEVDHINRDRQDNRLCNLRWVTRKENSQNRVYKRKDKIMCVDENYKWYQSYREASEMTGVSTNTIKRDVIGKTNLFRCNVKDRPKFFKTIEQVNQYWEKVECGN